MTLSSSLLVFPILMGAAPDAKWNVVMVILQMSVGRLRKYSRQTPVTLGLPSINRQARLHLQWTYVQSDHSLDHAHPLRDQVKIL